jgi:hypothetical protein
MTPVPGPSSSTGKPEAGRTTLAIFLAVTADVGAIAPTAFLLRFQPFRNSISSLNFNPTRCRMFIYAVAPAAWTHTTA